MPSFLRIPAIVLLFTYALFLVYSCSNEEKKVSENKTKVYASLTDSTKYVGIETCRKCHEDKYETFIQTGMGMSFDHASRQKSSAVFSAHDAVYDKYKNFYYHPHWDNDSLMITEFRLNGKDTIYERTEQISWIVGSGQHTNSHMMNVNGYVYQVPATFYTQKKQWDLPPGFEGRFNSRFSRMIGAECMTCHNAYPKLVEGSENKYSFIANGIDCERCHGPGSEHVKEKLAGSIIDIKKEVDYSIVNPAKLPIDYQLDVCQRCHIQGNSVLKTGKTFFDFRPGMRLSEVMDVYMPLYKGDQDSHIMASHAERMKMSKCFLVSIKKAEEENKLHPVLEPYKNAMTCVTCHNPHISVKRTDQSVFNNKCITCHYRNDKIIHNENSMVNSGECTESITVRRKNGDNCVSCHMLKGGTTDIPHVVNTDHWIRIPVKKNEIKKIKEFAGLICINNPEVSDKSKGAAFLSYFEKFSPNPAYLDSAKKYFDDSNTDSIKINFKNLIRIAFLRNDYRSVINYSNAFPDVIKLLVRKSPTNDDAWTAYRIGESYYSMGDVKNSILYYLVSVELAPYQPDFRNKLAGAQHDAGQIEDAKYNYEFILNEQPKYASAYVNYGYLLLTAFKDAEKADRMYDKALALDPDNIQALFNKAGIMIFRNNAAGARLYLKEVLKREGDNEKAKVLLKKLKTLL